MVAIAVVCTEDDEEAKERAWQDVDGYDVELWHRDQMIAQFKSEQ